MMKKNKIKNYILCYVVKQLSEIQSTFSRFADIIML